MNGGDDGTAKGCALIDFVGAGAACKAVYPLGPLVFNAT
jgi:hypothetical protein